MQELTGLSEANLTFNSYNNIFNDEMNDTCKSLLEISKISNLRSNFSSGKKIIINDYIFTEIEVNRLLDFLEAVALRSK